ncbi:MAG: GIY-YIG nuclease family protein [Verrucomicrobiota bacterium]
MNPGYIYILQNPSLSESHLKIGRTERDPEQRAAEISGSTGVPTPFEVVWWSESVDCHLAETLLHHELAPYRTNTTREFFDLELKDAIRVARRAIRRSGGEVGGLSYLFRRAFRWSFHGIVRPILRLPVQVILLAGLVMWWVLKGVLIVIFAILRGMLRALSTLFSPTKSKPRRRR